MSEYLIVRGHALKTRLLPKVVYDELIGADNLSAFVEILKLTGYNVDLIRLSRYDSRDLQKLFFDKLMKRYRLLLNSAEEKAWNLILSYGRKYEIQNILHILRNKSGKKTIEQTKKNLLSTWDFSDIDFEKMLQMNNVEEILRFLGETIYAKSIEGLELYWKFQSLLGITTKLKCIYYDHLLNASSQVPRGDRNELRRLIGTEIDVANCIMSLEWGIHEYDKDFARRLVIPFFHRISLESLLAGLRTTDPVAHKFLFRPYSRIVDYVLNEDYELAELEALRYIRREAHQEFIRDNSYAYVLSCLILCEVEYRDLTSLAFAKEYNINPMEIKKRLISTD